MKNKSIIMGTLAVSLLSISSFASADFDCSTIDKDEVKTLMDKEKSGETLTTDESSLFENMKNCRMERTGSGELKGSGKNMGSREFGMNNGSGSSQEQKVKFDELKSLMNKKNSGETLTSDEQAKLDEFNSKRNETGSGITDKKQKEFKNSKNNSLNNINSSYKTKIDNKIDSLVSNTSLDDSDKLQVLKNFLENLDTIQVSINNSTTLSDSKKSTYIDLINYFIESVNDRISKINNSETTDENIDQIINQVFGE